MRRRRSARGRTGGRRSGRRLQQNGAVGPVRRAGALAARAAPYVGALARGVYNAYRINRQVGMANRRVAARNDRLRGKRGSRVAKSVRGYGGEYGPTTVLKGKIGMGRKLPRKQLKLGYQKIVNRWQSINTMTDGSDVNMPGRVASRHCGDGSTGIDAPMQMFLLNQTQNGTVSYTSGPMYNASFNDTGGLVLGAILPQTADGTAAANGDWQPESYDPELTGDPMRYIMAAWYDIRIQAYGCTAQPTVYDIMIVQWKEQYLDPLETPSNAQEVADRHAVYQGLVQKNMSNPIMPVVVGRPKYRVLKRVRFVLQSTKTDENDKDPNSRIVKMFMRDGNTYDYRYHDDGFGGAGADSKLSTCQWTVQGALNGDYTNVPSPKARRWLIIRTMNTTKQANAAVCDASNTPSYNICVRRCEYQKSGN